MINDALKKVEFDTSLEITITELRKILRSYYKYGASLYDFKENKVYNLLNSSMNSDHKIMINNPIDTLNGITISEDLGYIWLGNDDDNLFYKSQDWYTIHKNVSINISIDKNFGTKLEAGTFKEGFLYVIGDVNKDLATNIDQRIQEKMADKRKNFALLPFATDDTGQLSIDFIELSNTTEDFLQNKYVENKAEITQGIGTLPERIMNLQPSQRSGNYQSSANERLNLMFDIYNGNVQEAQDTLQRLFKDHIDFDFFNDDIQENKQTKFERTKSLFQDNVITREEYLEEYNSLFGTSFKGNKYINQFNTFEGVLPNDQ